jgi:hypothetical protein
MSASAKMVSTMGSHRLRRSVVILAKCLGLILLGVEYISIPMLR